MPQISKVNFFSLIFGHNFDFETLFAPRNYEFDISVNMSCEGFVEGFFYDMLAAVLGLNLGPRSHTV